MSLTETIIKYESIISGYVWGTPLILFLIGTGIFLTIRLRFIQVREFTTAWRMMFSKRNSDAKGDISHFQALMTALAATIGAGNIAGVATAISVGGPGAVFWMWMTAIFGMATKYSEAILAVKYRRLDEKGEMAGGPMFALEYGMGQRWLGIAFAIFGVLASFGIGNMVQANSAAESLYSTFGIPKIYTGIVLSVMTAAIILGGIKRIGKVSAFMVPIMALIYIGFGLAIIAMHIREIPACFYIIFKQAFCPTAAAGGFLGSAVAQTIQMGVKRGLFSNESGMGSAPIAAAAAISQNPKQQALVSMLGTFIDTLVVCTITGLVIVVTGVWTSGDTGVALTVDAFSKGFSHQIAGIIVSISMVLFTYSTLIGWNYYGEKCLEYLTGCKSVFYFRIVWVILVFVGCVWQLEIVWNFSDIMNGLMAIPNLICLVALSSVIVNESKKKME